MNDRDRMLNQMVLGLFQKKCATFLATLYCGLRFSWSEEIPTACTDGTRLLANPTWFESMAPDMRITVLAHELWHVAYMHMGRLNHREPRMWNAACDHAINLMLKAHGYVFTIDHLADPRFTDLSSEQIYEVLEQEAQQQDPDGNGGDCHLPFGADIEMGPGGKMDPGKEQEVLGSIVRAVTMARMKPDEAGHLPGDLTTLVDQLLNPQLPWPVLLQRFMNELTNENRTWRKRNRRFQDLYLPSNGGQEGLDNILWAMDCSGSMRDSQLTVLNTEVKAVKTLFTPKHMTVVSFDTEVRDEWEFTEDDDFDRLTFHGRGGTDLHDLWRLIREKRPSCAVILSDLDVPIPVDSPGCPILWICMDRPQATVPYGQLVHVDSRTYVDG